MFEAARQYLNVHIGPIVYQQLQAQSAVSGRCREVQRGEATIVGLVHVSAVVDELVNHSILAVVAGNVQSCVSIDVDFVDLQSIQHRGS